MEDAEKQRELVPVDQHGAFEKSYSVFCEGKKPWDTYLTKVDLKNGDATSVAIIDVPSGKNWRSGSEAIV